MGTLIVLLVSTDKATEWTMVWRKPLSIHLDGDDDITSDVHSPVEWNGGAILSLSKEC